MMRTESAFRNLTSQGEGQLRGYSTAARIEGQSLTPALWRTDLRSVQGTVGEGRCGVAHSPSWRRRCSGRKSGYPAKFPPPFALTPPAFLCRWDARWATDSCGMLCAGLSLARKCMGLSPQTMQLWPGSVGKTARAIPFVDLSKSCQAQFA
jgi:hypothetical protein